MNDYCERCGKRGPEIHTCTPNPVIAKLRAQLAQTEQERDELAVQNQQMRQALKMYYKDFKLAGELLSLPDLANGVLNREKSNILREAATHWSGDGNIPERVVKLWLDDMADAIEKGEPNE